MNLKVCNKCGAQFMDGKLFWRTGKEGKKQDLAGLVCDKHGDDQCINDLRGTEHSGDTWEKRAAFIDGVTAGMKAAQDML